MAKELLNSLVQKEIVGIEGELVRLKKFIELDGPLFTIATDVKLIQRRAFRILDLCINDRERPGRR